MQILRSVLPFSLDRMAQLSRAWKRNIPENWLHLYPNLQTLSPKCRQIFSSLYKNRSITEWSFCTVGTNWPRSRVRPPAPPHTRPPRARAQVCPRTGGERDLPVKTPTFWPCRHSQPDMPCQKIMCFVLKLEFAVRDGILTSGPR